MMADWESSLAVRDGAFAQIFALTVLFYWVYRGCPQRIQPWLQAGGLAIFTSLFVAVLANIILWAP